MLQSTADEAPILVAYVPGLQLQQELSPDTENVPAIQKEQVAEDEPPELRVRVNQRLNLRLDIYNINGA